MPTKPEVMGSNPVRRVAPESPGNPRAFALLGLVVLLFLVLLTALAGPASAKAEVWKGFTAALDAYGAFQRVDIVLSARPPGPASSVPLRIRPGAQTRPEEAFVRLDNRQQGDHTDVIYRSGKDKALVYVAQREPTEITLTGYTSVGCMREEQLIDIAPLLVPVG